MVPKTIMHFLVNTFRNNLQNELVSTLYMNNKQQDHMEVLMSETEDVAARRRQCRDVKELLGRALEIVNEVRDFNSFQ